MVGIWFPTFAFVSLGFDHVVANMTFIPLAIWLGAPKITVALYIWKGIIPTLLGNIIGGGLFVGRCTSCELATVANQTSDILLVHVPHERRDGHSHGDAPVSHDDASFTGYRGHGC